MSSTEVAESTRKAAPRPGGRRRELIPRRAAFASMVVILVALFAAAAAPSPLLVVYQAEWGFAPWLLTFAFAIYAVALLASLLVFGSLSDHIGRRPVIIGALALQGVAMTVFLTSDDIGSVIVARILQGVATGAVTGAIAAMLTDLAPADNKKLGGIFASIGPLSGLGIGALATGLLIQVAEQPSKDVFLALDVLFALGIVVTFLVRESISVRPGGLRSLIPKVAVPRAARTVFAASVPGLISGWMINGFYLALVSAILGSVFEIHSGLVDGAAIAVFSFAGAAAVFVLRRRSSATNSVVGSLALIVGAAATVASLGTGSLVLFGIGAVLGGIGMGPSFAGAISSIMPHAQAHERGELFAAVYVVSYLAFGVPAIVAGIFISGAGLLTVSITYSVVIVVIAAVSLGAHLVRRPAARRV